MNKLNIKEIPGAYVIRWREGRHPNYRYAQETLRGVSKMEARRILIQRIAVAKAGRSTRRHERLSFADLVERYMNSRAPSFSVGWRRTVGGQLRHHILPAFGQCMLDSFRLLHFEDYRNRRVASGAANATINREMATIKAILRFAEDNGMLDKFPIPRRTLRPLPESPRSEFFTTDEWAAFTRSYDLGNAAWEDHLREIRRYGPVICDPTTGSARRHGASLRPDSEAASAYRDRLRASMDVFKVTLLTGCRISEVLGLTWEDVDLARSLISIYQPKTKRTKVLPLSPELRDLIRAQTRGIGKAPLLQRPGGGAWDLSRIEKAFRIARKVSRVRPSLTIHSIRHSAASWLTQEGFSERLVADYLGHAARSVTAGYSHLNADHLRPAAEQLGRLSRALVEPETGRALDANNTDREG